MASFYRKLLELPWRVLFLRLLLLCVPYFIALYAWNFPAALDRFLFLSDDSKQYHDFGKWLWGDGRSCSDVRPFLFPLLLQLCLKAGGPVFFWCFHFLLYIGSGLLMTHTVQRTTRSPIIATIALLLYSMNFSVAVLTLHALTEITGIFFITLLVYFLLSEQERHPNRRVLVFLCACLLALVKPLFLYPALFILAWMLWQEGGELLRRRAKALLLLFALLLTATQPLLMKLNYGRFFFSQIGEITLRDYYYEKLYADVNGIPLDLRSGGSEADLARIRSAVKDARTGDIAHYTLQHFPQAVRTYSDIVNTNLNVGSELVSAAGGPPFFERTMHYMKTIVLVLHALALLSFLLLLVRNRFRFAAFPPGLLPAYLLVLYILLASGISFWQGDRLVVIAVTGWLSVYPLLFLRLFRSARSVS